MPTFGPTPPPQGTDITRAAALAENAPLLELSRNGTHHRRTNGAKTKVGKKSMPRDPRRPQPETTAEALTISVAREVHRALPLADGTTDAVRDEAGGGATGEAVRVIEEGEEEKVAAERAAVETIRATPREVSGAQSKKKWKRLETMGSSI
jgi:hypothetical protein